MEGGRKHQQATKKPTPPRPLLQQLITIFLPAGFPASVTEDYVGYHPLTSRNRRTGCRHATHISPLASPQHAMLRVYRSSRSSRSSFFYVQ